MSSNDAYEVFASVEGPFAAGAVRLQSLRGRERISDVYTYVLDVWTVDLELSFADLNQADISVLLTDGDRERRINGRCVGFEERLSNEAADNRDFVRSYRLHLQPWFAAHGLVRDSRILEFGADDPKAVTDILPDIAGEADVSATTVGTIRRPFGSESSNITVAASRGPARPLYVQYRETTLAFLARLMERDGLAYHFEHLADKGVHLHVCDEPSQYPRLADPLEFLGASAQESVEGISELRLVAETAPAGHVGLSHDWMAGGTELVHASAASDASGSDPWRQSIAGLDSYEYLPDPSPADVADHVAFVGQAAAARSTRLEATTNSHVLQVGHTLGIGDAVAGRDLLGGDVLVIDAATTVESRETYGDSGSGAEGAVRCRVTCEFVAVPAVRPYRVPRRTPVPSPAGPQTALVVGIADNEITADEHLRVQVRFHWDQRNADDAHVCWVRVAQPLAGAGFGTHFIPRQGMEVVVDFVDGEVDQPLVTGCVYNGRNAPAFPMPDSANIIGLRSRSTTDGTAETFSLLSIDDTKDAEVMEVVAERDFRREVRNNDVLEVGLVHQDPGDQTITIHHDRTVTLKEGTDTLTISKGDRVVTIAEGADTLDVKAAITVTGEDTISITGTKAVTVESSEELKLICGSASITLKQNGDITISGTNIVVEGTGDVDLSATGNATLAGMAVKVDGTTAELAGSGTVDIAGGIVNIN